MTREEIEWRANQLAEQYTKKVGTYGSVEKNLDFNAHLAGFNACLDLLWPEVEKRRYKCEETSVCNVCNSCGEDGCCPVEKCRWPGIKEDTVREAKEYAEKTCIENYQLKAKLEKAKEALRCIRECCYSHEPYQIELHIDSKLKELGDE